MADTLLPAAATLFLLLLTLAAADTDGDLVVLDVEGNPLEAGSKYYIQRASIGFLGGIGRSGRGRTSLSCPLYAIEYQSEVNRGDPVKFVPNNETEKEIHLSSAVQIDSGRSAYCRSDGFWRVRFDAYTRGYVITASGTSSDSRSSFRIEKVKTTEGSLNAYKIAYSPPTTTSSSLQQRYYLTVFMDLLSGLKLVGLTEDSARAAPFVFFKNNKLDVIANM